MDALLRMDAKGVADRGAHRSMASTKASMLWMHC